MSHKRAIYASRFLRPPGWTKRLLLREKPRELTGPYENPVRRWVRLREKAKEFSELPPPRKIPYPKPVTEKSLPSVENVPTVDPEVLEKRVSFLLSQEAIAQQLSAPMRVGMTPFQVERAVWDRQMREIRRCYRAQYLQKLEEVTNQEREREEELRLIMRKQRQDKKAEHRKRVGEEMMRRAILKDRKRVETKVNEAIMMARRSKLKRNRLYWLRRLDTMSQISATAGNADEVMGKIPLSMFGTQDKNPASSQQYRAAEVSPSSSGVLLSRNVSVPFLLRQLGGAKGVPQQRSKRLPHVSNVAREVMESSYNILEEDAERFEKRESPVQSHRQRAKELYKAFTPQEKKDMAAAKLKIVEDQVDANAQAGRTDNVLMRLRDVLSLASSAKFAAEVDQAEKGQMRGQRGEDPDGFSAKDRKRRGGDEV